ncbi:MAG: hypothetical protein M3444_11040 [Acidobacteriota bacterium]|nr:hypothetical protein [Acidobacteriota bacterium]
MSARIKLPTPPQAQQHRPGQHPTETYRPGVLQTKTVATQAKKMPTAPPVYRPQAAPKVLQTKAATVLPPAAATRQLTPAAPHAYQPQPVPKVLQRKAALSTQTPGLAAKRPPAAPPVYRPHPEPKCLQAKRPAAPRSANQAKPSPVAAPAYRPQPTPRVLQLKKADGPGGGTRPAHAATPVHATAQATTQTRNGATPQPKVLRPGQWNAIQAKMIARLKTAYDEKSHQRVITDASLEGRMPTTVTKGQGDHTVASVLINRDVQGLVVGQTRLGAFMLLFQKMSELTDIKQKNINVEELIERYKEFFPRFKAFDEKEAEQVERGEDLNQVLEDMIENYVRAANKRHATAFTKKEKVTSGGGSEKKFIKALSNATNAETLATALYGLIDYDMTRNKTQNVQTCASVIMRAIDHALELKGIEALYAQHRQLILLLVTLMVKGGKIPSEQGQNVVNECAKRIPLHWLDYINND